MESDDRLVDWKTFDDAYGNLEDMLRETIDSIARLSSVVRENEENAITLHRMVEERVAILEAGMRPTGAQRAEVQALGKKMHAMDLSSDNRPDSTDLDAILITIMRVGGAHNTCPTFADDLQKVLSGRVRPNVIVIDYHQDYDASNGVIIVLFDAAAKDFNVPRSVSEVVRLTNKYSDSVVMGIVLQSTEAANSRGFKPASSAYNAGKNFRDVTYGRDGISMTDEHTKKTMHAVVDVINKWPH